MNITPEILLFLFEQKYPIRYQRIAKPGQTFRGIRLYDPQEQPDPSFLYVVSEMAFRRFSSADRRQFSILFLAMSTEDSAEALPEEPHLSLAAADGFTTPGHLYDALLQQFQTLLQQENELLLATMAGKEGSDTVFSYGKNWFPWEYSIVDLDMRLIYRTDNLHRVTGSDKVERIPMESIHDLILNREFHEAAQKKDVFYQSMTTSSLTAFARNILPDNQYAGRIVMFLEEPLKKAPKGAEELFKFYTDCIMESLRRSGHFTEQTQNNPLHLLCRSLLEGTEASTHAINDVFERIGWKQDDLFTVVTLRFLSDSAWQAQLETTLPYLADELENEWPQSCAVNNGAEINWVLNLSLSETDPRLDSFHQKVASFVRDHICIAGASPLFRNIALLARARTSATAALEIGHQKHPHIWFFSFDDYRLDYIRQNLQAALPADFLCHPAIRQLEDYDQINKTDLSQTLKAYLDCGRNMTLAADAIFVHRTTFCRRMDQVRKITGLDLSNPDTALLLELSYQLDRNS